MKFIKYAVGLVIALSVIPMVVIAVNKLDEPRLKTVEFEVINVDDTTITFSENTYNNIHSIAVSNTNGDVINLITTKVNDIELIDYTLSVSLDELYTFIHNSVVGDDFTWEDLNVSNVVVSEYYQATISDKWVMTFEVPSPTPPLIKLLVGFAPLLFVGGILLFMLNKRKLD